MSSIVVPTSFFSLLGFILNLPRDWSDPKKWILGVVHATTFHSPFEIVYVFNPLTPLDLSLLPSTKDMMYSDASERAKLIRDLHVKVKKEILRKVKRIIVMLIKLTNVGLKNRVKFAWYSSLPNCIRLNFFHNRFQLLLYKAYSCFCMGLVWYHTSCSVSYTHLTLPTKRIV